MVDRVLRHSKVRAEALTGLADRSAKIPESLFQTVIAVRDSMLRSKASEEVLVVVNERQNTDMMS